jgi:hypothetical protein
MQYCSYDSPYTKSENHKFDFCTVPEVRFICSAVTRCRQLHGAWHHFGIDCNRCTPSVLRVQVLHSTPDFIKHRAAMAMHCRLLAASTLLLLIIGARGGTTNLTLLRTAAEGHATAAASRQILQKQGPVRNSECLPSHQFSGQWRTWGWTAGQKDRNALHRHQVSCALLLHWGHQDTLHWL